MKRFDATWTAAAALVLGLGSATSALAQDPGCYSLCQEIANDCRAQAPPGNTAHCNREYRDCIAGCDAQAGVVRRSLDGMAGSPPQDVDGRCAAASRVPKLRVVDDAAVAPPTRGDQAGI